MKQLIFILSLLGFLSQPSFVYAQKKHAKDKVTSHEESAHKSMAATATFIEAGKAKMLGDITTATRLYNTCILADPENDAAYYELAAIYLDQNDASTAFRLSEKAYQLDEHNPWYGLQLLEVYRQLRKHSEAVKLAQHLAKEHPENPDFLFELADAYLVQNKYSDAIKIYDDIETQLGISEEISIQKQKIYAAQNKPLKAVAELEKLAAAFPDQSRYQALLAEMYMVAKMPEKALAAYQRLAEIDPTNPYIHISLSDFYRQQGDKQRSYDELKLGFANPSLDIDTKIRVMLAYYSISEIYLDMKEQAIELAQILRSTHPKDPKSHSMYADFLVRDNKLDEARNEFRIVLSLDSSKYVIWESVLQIDAQLTDYTALQSESSRAIELFPLQPLPYLLNGGAFIQQKKYTEAINSLNSGAKLVTGNDQLLAQFYAYLGDAYNALKDVEASDRAYDKSLMYNPNDPYVLNNYAYYLALRGKNLDKAEPMAKKSTEADPKNPSNIDTYAWVLFKLGKYQDAENVILKALELDEKADPTILEHYGDILFKLGQTEKAFEYWQKASSAGEGSDLLNKKIKEKILYE
ncbi:MAG: tetratricopeptide repeat protein [Bacteroidales bacterium]